ncbi:MAG: DNA-directed DNA polymerase [Candidatus Aenigmarchaeota archaeon]|nr:DNA-directed DNA polymerase [Candidatus Aenigmarchaeota archaeon]
MELFLLDADYEIDDGKGVIELFCKDKEGKTIIVKQPYQSYFYILTGFKDRVIEKLNEIGLKKVEVVERIVDGNFRKVLKVFVDNPRDVQKIREEIKDWKEIEDIYEFTVPYVYKYLLETEIEPCGWISFDSNARKIESDFQPKIKIMSFDIEVIDDENDEKIVMISLADNSGFKKMLSLKKSKSSFVQSFSSEKELIEKFVEIIKERDPDIILTYNGDAFDFVKLKIKSSKLKIGLNIGRNGEQIRFERRGRGSAASIKGRIHIDIYNFVDHILSNSLKTEVLTLDEVVKELLGEEKIKISWSEVKEKWKKDDIEHLVKYSQKDAEITLALGKYLLPQIFSLSKMTSSLPFDTSRYYYSQLVEHFLMKKSVHDKRIIPNMPRYDEINERKQFMPYTGAIVIEPKTGLHENITVFDFQSLYPSIIVTHNISPETLNCGHTECRNKNTTPEGKNYYCVQTRGFISKHLEEIIHERRRIKEMIKDEKNKQKISLLKNQQYSLKIIANAMYGYFGYPGSRWYCRSCGESCAAFGRYYITFVLQSAAENGFQVIYADTDSCFVKLEKESDLEKILKWNKKVNDELPGIIELEYRDFYPAGIFVAKKADEKGAKKRYALLTKDGKLEIRGFETVRRDWCELAKKVQHEVLRIILVEKNLDKAVNYVKDTIKELNAGKAKIEDLAIKTQLVMPLSEYKQIGPHVKVGMKLKQKGIDVVEGMILQYVITKGKGSISDRAEPLEFVKEKDYDPDYYVNNQILPAALRVLQAFNINEDLSIDKNSSLHKWFK